MAAGLFPVVGLYVFLFAALCALHGPKQILGKLAYIVPVVLAFVYAHGLISFLINTTFNLDHFLQSYVFLIIYILAASFLVFLAQGVPKYKADFAVKLVFYPLLLSGLATSLGYRALGNPSAVGFFSENSHFALSFLPFLLYIVVFSSWKKKCFFLFMGFMISLILKSVTLLIGVIFVAIIALRLRHLLLLSIISILILMVAIDYADIEYFLNRLDFSNPNLSLLSFMNGWERAYLNLKDSYGFGVGFQQLGFIMSEGEIKMFELLRLISAENLNLYDGSFIAAKLISEFGILAVMLLVAYLVNFARSVRWLHEVSINGGETVDCREVFFLACFVMFFIDLFLRGTGYFSSTGFLFIASVVWIVLPPVSRTPLRIPHDGETRLSSTKPCEASLVRGPE
tara:strand:+ start:823 stop:2016 length:1194 start_codon:yes stop_codon:yes gene_type:complete